MTVRLPRMRFTVRRMVVAVAVAAIATGGLVLWQRSVEYQNRAAVAERNERDNAEKEEWMCKVWTGYLGKTGVPSDSLRFKRAKERYARIKLVYQRTARYPWLTVTPDLSELP